MKKIYTKPEIIFEDFTLSENIAAGCEYTTNTMTVDTCAYPTRGGNLAIEGIISDCNVYPGDDGAYQNFCYHVPNENNNIFNS